MLTVRVCAPCTCAACVSQFVRTLRLWGGAKRPLSVLGTCMPSWTRMMRYMLRHISASQTFIAWCVCAHFRALMLSCVHVGVHFDSIRAFAHASRYVSHVRGVHQGCCAYLLSYIHVYLNALIRPFVRIYIHAFIDSCCTPIPSLPAPPLLQSPPPQRQSQTSLQTQP